MIVAVSRATVSLPSMLNASASVVWTSSGCARKIGEEGREHGVPAIDAACPE